MKLKQRPGFPGAPAKQRVRASQALRYDQRHTTGPPSAWLTRASPARGHNSTRKKKRTKTLSQQRHSPRLRLGLICSHRNVTDTTATHLFENPVCVAGRCCDGEGEEAQDGDQEDGAGEELERCASGDLLTRAQATDKRIKSLQAADAAEQQRKVEEEADMQLR
jgi:hypothetical protein